MIKFIPMKPNGILDFNILDIFQKIEALGFLVNPQWFKELSLANTIIFLRELYDIWCHRAQISDEIKQRIYPRGNPFRIMHTHSITLSNSIYELVIAIKSYYNF